MATEYDASCIHELFTRQALRTPDAVAVACKAQALTYSELDRRSNQLARHLMDLGVQRGSLVPICVERSVDMMVALLGIWKAGAAYVPLDPSYPEERLLMMLEDCCGSLVVTQEHLLKKTSVASLHVLLDRDWPAVSNHSPESVPGVATVEDLAYVIYTSGSTGRPKGVMITHRNVANFFAGMDERIQGSPGIWLSLTSISFDISVLELFWTLARGFQVVIQPDEAVTALASRRNVQRKMHFSLLYFASDESTAGKEKYRLLVEGARFADRHGFHAIWTPERHFHEFGGLFPNPSVISAAIAVITSQLQIRAGSVVLPLHDPIRVAEEWSTVDNLSGGRVGISFASGWHERDFVFAPTSFADRRRILFREIETVQRLWRGETVLRTSGAGTEVEVSILPRPVQPELPVWVTAAGDPETFRMAGETGANLLTHLLGQSLDQVARNIAFYRRARAEHHPDAGPGQVTLMLHAFIGDSQEKVRETVQAPLCRYLKSSVGLMKQAIHGLGREFASEQLTVQDLESVIDHAFDRYFVESGLFGTPESCRERVERLIEIDVDELACLIDFGVGEDDVLEGLKRLAVLKERVSRDLSDPTSFSIVAQINQHGVTHLQCTPSLARTILLMEGGPAALAKLEVLCVGGEAMPDKLAAELEELLPGRVWNMYGPTETTIWSTTHRLNPDEGAVPIGRPIANTYAYVVDDRLQLLPAGVAGELLLGGEGVARGYLNRPHLTAERFLTDPFRSEPLARVYRTGDLVIRRPDGLFVFVGRMDHQVKVRGHRIELGDVEAALAAHSGIREAVAACIEGTDGEAALVGYVVPREGTWPTEGELKRYVATRLPSYMIPSTIISTSRLPLTPNGKVDRKQLLTLQRGGTHAQIKLPRNRLEASLVEIWKEILQVSEVDIHDNFFDIGGHSLSAVQVIFRIREVTGTDLSLASFLQEPTVAGQASALEALAGAPAGGASLSQILAEVASLSDEEAADLLQRGE